MKNDIEEYITSMREAIVIDYVNGNYVVENKSFVEGKQAARKFQGIGINLELAIQNFIDSWKHSQNSKNKMELDSEDYMWHSSH